MTKYGVRLSFDGESHTMLEDGECYEDEKPSWVDRAKGLANEYGRVILLEFKPVEELYTVEPGEE